MSGVVCVIDAGTTGVRAGLVDDRGNVCAQVHADLTTDYPAPGYAEQSLDEVWRVTAGTLRPVVAKADELGTRIEAVTLTAQRASVSALRNGRPHTPLVLWMDRRGTDVVDTFARKFDAADFAEITGIPLSPMPAVACLLWLREHRPDVLATADQFVGVQEWLVTNLTGQAPVTDASCASWMGLMDLAAREWSQDLLDEVGVDATKLPAIASATTSGGTVDAEASTATGLPVGTPVYLGGGDQQCSAAGGGGVGAGAATINLGTSATFVFASAARHSAGGFVHAAHVVEPLLSVEGTIPACGSVLRWLRSLLGYPEGDAGYDAMMTDAGTAPPTAEGLLFVPAMAGHGTPRWTPAAGAIDGLGFHHDAAALVRTAVEGIALQAREVLDALPVPLRPTGALTAIGGGARSAFFCQTLADVTGVPVEVKEGDPQAAPLRGAAMCAWVGLGRHPSIEEASRGLGAARTHRPDPDHRQVYASLFERYLEHAAAAAARNARAAAG